jgi:hypothetical protein
MLSELANGDLWGRSQTVPVGISKRWPTAQHGAEPLVWLRPWRPAVGCVGLQLVFANGRSVRGGDRHLKPPATKMLHSGECFMSSVGGEAVSQKSPARSFRNNNVGQRGLLSNRCRQDEFLIDARLCTSAHTSPNEEDGDAGPRRKKESEVCALIQHLKESEQIIALVRPPSNVGSAPQTSAQGVRCHEQRSTLRLLRAAKTSGKNSAHIRLRLRSVFQGSTRQSRGHKMDFETQ